MELAAKRQSRSRQSAPRQPVPRQPVPRPTNEDQEAGTDRHEIVSYTSEDENQGVDYVVSENDTNDSKPKDTGEYDENEMYQELGD